MRYKFTYPNLSRFVYTFPYLFSWLSLLQIPSSLNSLLLLLFSEEVVFNLKGFGVVLFISIVRFFLLMLFYRFPVVLWRTKEFTVFLFSSKSHTRLRNFNCSASRLNYHFNRCRRSWRQFDFIIFWWKRKGGFFSFKSNFLLQAKCKFDSKLILNTR